MKIDYLWHSELLITLKNNFNQDIKILSDAWLSWYSVADLMQKNPITNIDLDNFSPDAVFISHAHMDHLDPYSLKKIFNKKDKPLLLLPETLEYLKDIFEKNLSCEIKILKNKETFSFKWINIQWIIFPDWMNTNESDVMTLSVWNDEEIVFTEIDMVPPDSEEWIWYIYKLFTQKDFKTRLYISTRNELVWNLTIVDLPVSEQENFAQQYRQTRIQEIYQHYNNIFVLEEENIPANIYTLPGFVRTFIWQGIIFPAKEFGPEVLKLKIMSLEENVELEKEIINDFWFTYPMYAMDEVGDEIQNCVYKWLGRYVFENGDLREKGKISYLDGEYFKCKQSLPCDCKRTLKDKPIIEKYDANNDIERVLTYLNNVFLPYQYGRLDANLKNLALENDGKYIIQIKKWNNGKEILWYFVWTLWWTGFVYTDKNLSTYNETYFIEDLINFLDGKIELYSNFWQYLEEWTNIYLWECLWANYLNNDIVRKKISYHFDLANKWISPEKFVLDIIKD